MLTFEDCLGLCELSEEEIRAIAEHEHLPQIVALELGSDLMRGPDGELLASHMLIDDIRAAERRGDRVHAAAQARAAPAHRAAWRAPRRRPGALR